NSRAPSHSGKPGASARWLNHRDSAPGGGAVTRHLPTLGRSHTSPLKQPPHYPTPSEGYPIYFGKGGYDFGVGRPIRSAILTKAATDPARIFSITCCRCTLTEASLVPSSAAICLLSSPLTTSAITSRSRGVSSR